MTSRQMKREAKRRLRRKIILICFVAILLLCLFVGYLVTMDMHNVSQDFMMQKYDSSIHDNNSKLQFAKSYNVQKEKQSQNDRDEGNKNGNSGGVGIKDGQLVAKENGVLITDTTINPSGLPLYDGWSLDVDKLKLVAADLGVDPNTVVYFDLDFEQFWNTDNFKDNPGLYGLGDFTNSKPGSRNMISYGSTQGLYKSSGQLEIISSPKGNVSTFDNRVLFAVPGRFFTDPALLTEEKLAQLSDNCGLNRTSPAGATANYANCYRLTYNQFENMIHDWTNCVPSSYYHKGMYFDILFDDGTVLAATEADGKGVHVGSDNRGSWCEDTLMQGYGQVRFNSADPNKVGYQSFLEIYSPGAKNNGLDINLESKKVVGVRCYTVGGHDNGSWIKWGELSKQK